MGSAHPAFTNQEFSELTQGAEFHPNHLENFAQSSDLVTPTDSGLRSAERAYGFRIRIEAGFRLKSLAGTTNGMMPECRDHGIPEPGPGSVWKPAINDPAFVGTTESWLCIGLSLGATGELPLSSLKHPETSI